MRIRLCFTSILICIWCYTSVAQQIDSSLDKLALLPNKLFKKITTSTAHLDGQISRRTEKSLKRMAKREEKLRLELISKDSTAAKNLFSGSQEKYSALIASLHNAKPNSVQEYIPGLDSIQTAMRFISQAGNKFQDFLPKN